jgi:Fimbrial protein.
MGSIPQWRFTRPGDLSEPVPVHLILEHCLYGGHVRSPEHGDNLYWFTDQPMVMMNIIGDEEPDYPHLFKIYGEAKGIALRLEDAHHNAIYPGERTRPQLLTPGRNDLVINAQLSRTAKALALGDFTAVINVGLEYF